MTPHSEDQTGGPAAVLATDSLARCSCCWPRCGVFRVDRYGDRGNGLSQRFDYDLDAYQQVDPGKVALSRRPADTGSGA